MNLSRLATHVAGDPSAATFLLTILFGQYIVCYGLKLEHGDTAEPPTRPRRGDLRGDPERRPCRVRRHTDMHSNIAADMSSTIALLYFSCCLQAPALPMMASAIVRLPFRQQRRSPQPTLRDGRGKTVTAGVRHRHARRSPTPPYHLRVFPIWIDEQRRPRRRRYGSAVGKSPHPALPRRRGRVLWGIVLHRCTPFPVEGAVEGAAMTRRTSHPAARRAKPSTLGFSGRGARLPGFQKGAAP
jgi:hypothetical protein